MNKTKINKPDLHLCLKEPSKQRLSSCRRMCFAILMFLLPLLIFLVVELILRFVNYGNTLDLFVLRENGGASEYIINKDFTKRYFFQKGIDTPVPITQTFSAFKDSLTYRVFCLGESSVQGFPYQPNCAFPAMLKNILTTLHPYKKIEVVNCGVTAISSFVVADMAEEIIEKHKPDLLVIYTGHNEFYGVFGSASRLSFLRNYTLTHILLRLQSLKTFQLIKNTINYFFGSDISKDPTLRRGTMMGIVARDVGIRATDELVEETQIYFRKNIESVVKKAKKYGIDVILCSLVSNIKDFPPFASLHSLSFNSSDSLTWSRLVYEAENQQRKKQFKDAIGFYLKALKIDSTFADVHYQLGKCYYELGEFGLAKKHFELASNLDVIRFRAPTTFNNILQQISIEYNVPFADVCKSFESQSENRIIGDELVFEHVHPNQKGYLQIARCVARTMSENKLLSSSWDWTKDLTDDEYCSMSKMTILDEEIVNAVLCKLTSHWPFTNKHRKIFVSKGNAKTEELARRHINEDISVVDLHIEYAKFLESKNKYDEAIEEYEAALAMYPVSQIYNYLGRLYLIKTEKAYRDSKNFTVAGNYFNSAEQCFKEGLRLEPNNLELNFNLGVLYLMRKDKWQDAEERLKKVLAINPSHQRAILLLSQLYLRTEKIDDAKSTLQKGIGYYPKSAEFYANLGAVYLCEKNYKEARKYLEHAVNMNDDTKAKHLLQVLTNNKMNLSLN